MYTSDHHLKCHSISRSVRRALRSCILIAYAWHRQTPSSEGPDKSSSATGHTATPALFLAYQVFMLDARNCSKNFFNNSLATTTVCVTWYRPDMRDPSITDRLRSANKFPAISARTNRFKYTTCYGLANYQWLWLVFYCVIVYCMNLHLL